MSEKVEQTPSIWIIKHRSRARSNERWSEWEFSYSRFYYVNRPVTQELKHTCVEKCAFEYKSVEAKP